MLRLILPLFLCSYLPALLIRSLLFLLLPNLYRNYHLFNHPLSLFSLLPFFFDATWATLLSIATAIIFGTLWSLKYAIVGALSAGFWGGVAVQTVLGTPGYIFVAHAVIFVVGIVSGVAIGSAHDIARSSGRGTRLGTVIGLVFGVLIGIPIGVFAALVGGVAVYHTLVTKILVKSVVGSTVSALVGALLAALISGIIYGIIKGIYRTRILDIGVERAVSVVLASSIAVAAAFGGIIGTAVGFKGVAGIDFSWKHYIFPDLSAAPGFIIYYMLGYYRLPLYPFSAFSSIKTYFESIKNPTDAFDYLHASALHWDECVFLPLPLLKQTLTRASKQKITGQDRIKMTYEELIFIARERRNQLPYVYSVVHDIILHQLTWRNTLQFIARANDEVIAYLRERGVILLDPMLTAWWGGLSSVCSEAARYQNTSRRSIKSDALEQIITILAQRENRLSNDAEINIRWQKMLQDWETLVHNELKELGYKDEQIGKIDNPYTFGGALKGRAISSFVGREDIIYTVEQALKDNKNRPVFFLTGERCMGKTSLLHQFSYKLSSRHIPVVIDLQTEGSTGSTALFLKDTADKICAAMRHRAYRCTTFTLDTSRYDNDDILYHYFTAWLRSIDTVLERNEKDGDEKSVILLVFDEFEKLEKAGTKQQLDIQSLLKYLNALQQNHPHIALLFSGTRTYAEMKEEYWRESFTNPRKLKVSYLEPSEARKLVLHPTPSFSGQKIFEEEVVQEILRLTGNHPYYIQYFCSQIIYRLNDTNQAKASLQDILEVKEDAIEQFKDSQFYSVWRSISEGQRQCLQIVKQQGCVSKHQLAELLDPLEASEIRVTRILAQLRKRDLLIVENSSYRIAAPIIEELIERMQEEVIEHSEYSII